jgi:hypothetical protein
MVLRTGKRSRSRTDLRLDEDEVDEEHHEIMLDVLVAEAPALATHSQSNIVPARLVAGARVLCP